MTHFKKPKDLLTSEDKDDLISWIVTQKVNLSFVMFLFSPHDNPVFVELLIH